MEPYQNIRNGIINLVNQTRLFDELAYLVGQEKPGFRKIITPEDFYNAIICVKPKADNPRIQAQQGAFLIYGVNESKENMPEINTLDCDIDEIVIPGHLRKDILDYLDKMGINGARLFP